MAIKHEEAYQGMAARIVSTGEWVTIAVVRQTSIIVKDGTGARFAVSADDLEE